MGNIVSVRCCDIILFCRLSGCMVTEKGCGFLVSALKSNPSYLKELDLSYNNFGEYGVGALTERREDAGCKLEIFK